MAKPSRNPGTSGGRAAVPPCASLFVRRRWVLRRIARRVGSRSQWTNVAVALLIAVAGALAKPQTCDVCVRVLDKLVAEIPKKDLKNLDKIESVLNAFCEKHKDGEERRVCYS